MRSVPYAYILPHGVIEPQEKIQMLQTRIIDKKTVVQMDIYRGKY